MTEPRPSRARYVLVLWLCGLAGVLYLDRICMGQAAKPIERELGLSNTQLGYIAIAFTLAYGIFEMPTGRLGDRLGSRFVLTRIVVWWSIFTALTGATWGFASLVVVRFLFGAGEAGAFPNAARVIARWFPAGERGRVQGIMLTAAQLGGVAAPTAAALLIEFVGWRAAFGIFGVIGLVWAVGFWYWFTDDPADHDGVNKDELAIIQSTGDKPTKHSEPIPWGPVLSNAGIWILGIAITCSAFNSYMYFTWFPKYLMDARQIENIEAGWLSSLVLAGSAGGVLLGGVVADRILKSGRDLVICRRILGVCMFIAAALLLFVATRQDSALAMAAIAAASCFCLQIVLPTWWSSAIEQSGKHVGSLFGMMNMIGLVGAMVSQWFVGWFADYQKDRGLSGREQWDPMFNVFVGVLLMGAIMWALYRRRPVE
jgi:sugar phosphate permease